MSIEADVETCCAEISDSFTDGDNAQLREETKISTLFANPTLGTSLPQDWLKPNCNVKLGVVISLQGTRAVDRSFVCKELGVYFLETGETSSYVFQPPDDTEVDKEEDNFVTKCLHGIEWSAGITPYHFLASMLEAVTQGRCCFTKGMENCRFLYSFGVHVHNLEDICCPIATKLPFEKVNCTVTGHDINPYCGARRAIQWGKFLLLTFSQ